MSSGLRTMKFNTRERALSTDVNRLQSFMASDLAETLRSLFMRPIDDYSFLGAALTSTPNGLYASDESVDRSDIVGTPLQGMVLAGLTVILPVGATSLIVQPGVVMFADPDGQSGSSDPDLPNTDDNPCKVIRDPGIQTLGILTWTPNAGPGRRMDYVEVRRQQIVQEADNRDIYDPVTATFTASTVDKVEVAQLEYRIRLGTQGAGLPALAQGWMPIVVLSTPSSAVSLDTIDAWDVRPLASDLDTGRVRNPGAITTFTKRELVLDVFQAPGEGRLRGSIDGFSRGGWRIGGRIAQPDGTTRVDILNPEIAQSGFAPGGSSMWRVFAMFPRGLPRWVRYSSVTFAALAGGLPGRGPGTFRGVLVTTAAVQDFNGCPLVAVAMPTVLGFTGTETKGYLVAVGTTDSLGDLQCFVESTKCGVQFPWRGQSPTIPWRTVPDTTTWSFLTSDIRNSAPPSAKSVRIITQLLTTGLAPGDVTNARVVAALRTTAGQVMSVAHIHHAAQVRPSATNIIIQCEFDMPLTGVPDSLDFGVDDGAAGLLPSGGATLIVGGWSFI